MPFILILVMSVLILPAFAKAQGQPGAGQAVQQQAGKKQAEDPKAAAEIKALRKAAKPMLDYVKAHSGDLAAVKKRHAQSSKALQAKLTGGPGDEKVKKELRMLGKQQREEFRRELEAVREDNRKFVKKNPEADKAMKELINRGIPAEDPASP
jgi:hypothetical protein